MKTSEIFLYFKSRNERLESYFTKLLNCWFDFYNHPVADKKELEIKIAVG
jgi:hypothetical protein